jgi:3-methyladenine DNA glycosylase Tag
MQKPDQLKKSDKDLKTIFRLVLDTLKKRDAELPLDKRNFLGFEGWDPFDHTILNQHEKAYPLNDGKFWQAIYKAIYHANRKSKTIEGYYPVFEKYLDDYKQVAAFDKQRIKAILADPDFYQSEERLKALVANAKAFVQIVKESGGIRQYLACFCQTPDELVKNPKTVEKLRKDLVKKGFKRFGSATMEHTLQISGLDILKADITIMRDFYRLGIIDEKINTSRAHKATVLVAQYYAELMGIPVAYLDSLFHLLGRQDMEICTDEPDCAFCLANTSCMQRIC